MYVSKGPKSSTKINTVPVNKTRMSIPDVLIDAAAET